MNDLFLNAKHLFLLIILQLNLAQFGAKEVFQISEFPMNFSMWMGSSSPGDVEG